MRITFSQLAHVPICREKLKWNQRDMRPDALNGLQVDQRDNHSIARRQQNGVRFYGGKDVFAKRRAIALLL